MIRSGRRRSNQQRRCKRYETYRSAAFFGFISPEFSRPNHFHLPPTPEIYTLRRSKSLENVSAKGKWRKAPTDRKRSCSAQREKSPEVNESFKRKLNFNAGTSMEMLEDDHIRTNPYKAHYCDQVTQTFGTIMIDEQCQATVERNTQASQTTEEFRKQEIGAGDIEKLPEVADDVVGLIEIIISRLVKLSEDNLENITKCCSIVTVQDSPTKYNLISFIDNKIKSLMQIQQNTSSMFLGKLKELNYTSGSFSLASAVAFSTHIDQSDSVQLTQSLQERMKHLELQRSYSNYVECIPYISFDEHVDGIGYWGITLSEVLNNMANESSGRDSDSGLKRTDLSVVSVSGEAEPNNRFSSSTPKLRTCFQNQSFYTLNFSELLDTSCSVISNDELAKELDGENRAATTIELIDSSKMEEDAVETQEQNFNMEPLENVKETIEPDVSASEPVTTADVNTEEKEDKENSENSPDKALPAITYIIPVIQSEHPFETVSTEETQEIGETFGPIFEVILPINNEVINETEDCEIQKTGIPVVSDFKAANPTEFEDRCSEVCLGKDEKPSVLSSKKKRDRNFIDENIKNITTLSANKVHQNASALFSTVNPFGDTTSATPIARKNAKQPKKLIKPELPCCDSFQKSGRNKKKKTGNTKPVVAKPVERPVTAFRKTTMANSLQYELEINTQTYHENMDYLNTVKERLNNHVVHQEEMSSVLDENIRLINKSLQQASEIRSEIENDRQNVRVDLESNFQQDFTFLSGSSMNLLENED